MDSDRYISKRDSFIKVGDHVYYQAGSPIGIVIEIDELTVLVRYCWGVYHLYNIDEVTSTLMPLSK